MKKKLLVTSIVLISSVIGGIWYYFASAYINTDDARVKMANLQIVSEVSGYINKINIIEGQFVKPNDVLLKLDNRQYLIDYKRTLSTFEKAKSSYEYAKMDFLGRKTLVKNKLISILEFEQFKQAFMIAEKGIEESREIMNLAEYKLNRTIIHSPGKGKVSNFNLKIGDYVNIGSPLFSIIDIDDIWIEANFKEKDLRGVKIGQIAEVEIDAYPGVIWHAKVTSITPATEAEFSMLPAQNTSGNWIKVVQRVQIRLEFEPNQEIKKLGSGLSAIVTINIRK